MSPRCARWQRQRRRGGPYEGQSAMAGARIGRAIVHGGRSSTVRPASPWLGFYPRRRHMGAYRPLTNGSGSSCENSRAATNLSFPEVKLALSIAYMLASWTDSCARIPYGWRFPASNACFHGLGVVVNDAVPGFVPRIPAHPDYDALGIVSIELCV